MRAVVQRKSAIDASMAGMAKAAEGAVSGVAEARENRKLYAQQMEDRFKTQAGFDDRLRALQLQADEGRLTRAQEAELAEAQLRHDEWKTNYTTTASTEVAKADREAAERDSRRRHDIERRRITSEEQQLQARLEAELQKDGGHMKNNAATAAVVLRSMGMTSQDYASLEPEKKKEILAIALKTTGFTFSQEHDWMQDADARMFDRMLLNSDAYQASLDEAEQKKFQREVDAKANLQRQATGQAADGQGGVSLEDDQYVAQARPDTSPVTGIIFQVADKPKSALEMSGIGVNFEPLKSRVGAAPLNQTKALLDQQVKTILAATTSTQRNALAEQAQTTLTRHMQATYGTITSLSPNEKRDMHKALSEIINAAARPALQISPDGSMGQQVYPAVPSTNGQKNNSGRRGGP